MFDCFLEIFFRLVDSSVWSLMEEINETFFLACLII